jgi:glutamine synthetase adenylyltransferase
MTDEEFREQHKPLQVPAAYDDAETMTDKVVFALADIGEGTAEDVIRHIEELHPDAEHKPIIASAHQILTELYDAGRVTGHEEDGDLVFNLHKITEANDGKVNPDLLAPGLD